MAELVDYNGNNIEESLLVSSTSHGLISKESNSHLEYVYNARGQFGGTVKTQGPNNPNRLVYKYRVYFEDNGTAIDQKIPYLLLLSNNNNVSVFTGVLFSMDSSLISFTPTKIFNNTEGPVNVSGKLLKYETYVLEVQFTADYGYWSTCSLIVPGYRVECFD